jgi:hypothetical protein
MVMCKIVCVCNLESMLQLKQESNEKACAGIEFACVLMLKLYDSAGFKERIVVSQRMSFCCELCCWHRISFAAKLCSVQRMSFPCGIVCQQRISFTTELWFVANQFRCRTVLSAVNEFSLPNYVSPANHFRCQNVLAAANEFSLPNCVLVGINFAIELCSLQ